MTMLHDIRGAFFIVTLRFHFLFFSPFTLRFPCGTLFAANPSAKLSSEPFSFSKRPIRGGDSLGR
jgi:hypothetical protein